MNSGNVITGCTTAVTLPRDEAWVDQLGAMKTSTLSHELISKDSINNSKQLSLIHSEPLILPCDHINEDKSSTLISIPRDQSSDLHDQPNAQEFNPRPLISSPRDQLADLHDQPVDQAIISSHLDTNTPRDEIILETSHCSPRDDFMPQDKHTTIDATHVDLIDSTSSYNNLSMISTDPKSLSTGSKSPSYCKDLIPYNSASLSKPGSLPNCLQSLPPSIIIPEGYKWIFIHGRWTLIPSINAEKFYSQDLSPQDAIQEDPTDEEFVY